MDEPRLAPAAYVLVLLDAPVLALDEDPDEDPALPGDEPDDPDVLAAPLVLADFVLLADEPPRESVR